MHPDIKPACFRAMMMTEEPQMLDVFIEKYRAENNISTKILILKSLSQAQSEELLKKVLEFGWGDDVGNHDFVYIISNVAINPVSFYSFQKIIYLVSELHKIV